MGWLYLLGAVIFPPVFILWRPRSQASPVALRLRLAGAVAVVWLLTILWSARSSIYTGEMVETDALATPQETSVWSTDASSDTSLIMLLGWIPGLVYAGLLMLARKGLEQSRGAQVMERHG